MAELCMAELQDALKESERKINSLKTKIDTLRALLSPFQIGASEIIFKQRIHMENALQMLASVDHRGFPEDAYETRAYLDIAERELKKGLAGR